MELYAKGQLSFLMLTCLQERDFYGLDIISEIENKSNGRIKLKKPSVYSNLTRMEKQSYITSYLKSSDFGPNRKYYSLTESGRNFYKELKEYYDRNNIDVFKDFIDADSPANEIKIQQEESEKSDEFSIENKENDDFFDFSSITKEISPIEPQKDEKIDDDITETSVEIESVVHQTEANETHEQNNEIITNNHENEDIKEEISQEINDANEEKSTSQEQNSEAIDEYNKRLYDISKDINKFKRKRSFAEDQIAMTATAPLVDSQEKTKANIEDFKSSFLENKTKYQSERLDYLDFSRYTANKKIIQEEKPKQEEIKNDSVFITERYNIDDFKKPRKIEPPRLKITPIETTKETKLPAPKRDVAIDPSHKEILTKLYSKSKDSNASEVREDALYDFDDLKAYYKEQNIAFNEYKKSADKNEHNTNKLYLFVSLISFAMSSALSAVLFAILFSTNLLYDKTNFLYILLPALLIVDLIWKFYNFKQFKNWLPSQLLPQWQIWALFLIVSGLTICLNFICGMSAENFALYATTTILPIVMAFVLLPVRYYIKRILLVKYWK